MTAGIGHVGRHGWRVRIAVIIALCLASVGLSAPHAARAAGDNGSGYYVTFVARSCPEYTDIFANKARNDIQESLKDLGPDTPYINSDALVDPSVESGPPQDVCAALPNW